MATVPSATTFTVTGQATGTGLYTAPTGQVWPLLGLDAWSNRALGAGRTNTAYMVARCAAGAAVTANAYSTAQAAAGSWWLPSLGELLEMYRNLSAAGVGGFAIEDYWSSSENTPTGAGAQDFVDGVQTGGFNKSANHRVRPVRAF